MQEDHQKISSCEIMSNGRGVRYSIIKDLNHFELLRYGSYKSFMTQSRKSDKQF